MIHAAKPGQVPQEFLAERSLKPGEILKLRCPTLEMILLLSLLAEYLPGIVGLRQFDTTADEVSAFRRQGQMVASGGGWCFAKWTVSLVHHGHERKAGYPYLANEEIRQVKA
jgi:hypothetical protein